MIVFEYKSEIFSFSVLGFDFAIRWYAVSYILGFVVALWIMKFVLKRRPLWKNNNPPMTVENADNLLTYLIVGVIVGGRMGPCFFIALTIICSIRQTS